ncbi:type II toxin-antitoxin system prevent-host-death family antitoxin [Salinisphaera sp.]|uniref:type II toxin-antitoxin system Phd/YefM family antitoxin n=1 Tax=Salinisphaera sp. TaxID=1914330 RepID=UPI002D784B0D|nr:type II toxin-antitoxin system prevent-host-death family antitoxin [Salinisphaera sp.]HET7315428.1 type II toxin-antitoxin system prevent-host-death family antitoxin [Salinisphaera sp.]
MNIINIHEAKTQLSRLVERAANGEPFIIAKAGKPLVKVSAASAPDSGQSARLGFLSGAFETPDDFNRMHADPIAELFYGDEP